MIKVRTVCQINKPIEMAKLLSLFPRVVMCTDGKRQQRGPDSFIPHAAATSVLPLNAAFTVTRPRLADNKSVRGAQLPLPPVSTRVMAKKVVQRVLGRSLGVGVDVQPDLSVSDLYELSALQQEHLQAKRQRQQHAKALTIK